MSLWFSLKIVFNKSWVGQGVDGKIQAVAAHTNWTNHFFIGSQIPVLVVFDFVECFSVHQNWHARHVATGTSHGLLRLWILLPVHPVWRIFVIAAVLVIVASQATFDGRALWVKFMSSVTAIAAVGQCLRLDRKGHVRICR